MREGLMVASLGATAFPEWWRAPRRRSAGGACWRLAPRAQRVRWARATPTAASAPRCKIS